jgi:uncharacterized membrane protein YagU involved in acid resistance
MISRGAVLAILVGGGVAAGVDIVYAFVSAAQYGRTPTWVLQSVASGWLGKDAFKAGAGGAALGLASHFAILFVAAALYLAASRKWPVLCTHAVACGALYGIGIYLFMNFAVLPLSAFPFKLTYPWLRLVEGFGSHALFVGIPIAVAVRWLDAGRPKPMG